MKFTEEHVMLEETVRTFLKKEAEPILMINEGKKVCSKEILQALGKQGFTGVSYPTAVGGSGLDFWSAVIVMKELAYLNYGGFTGSYYANTYLPLPLISAIGTKSQKEEFLTPALHGEKIASLAITEPSGGSDVRGMQTFAEDKGDHFLLNGQKLWITNGNIADFIVVIAKTNKEKNSLSALILDTKNTKGFSSMDMGFKLGWHSSDTAQLFFNNCKIPKENLLGEKDKGFYYLMNNIQEERVLASVIASWTAKYAVDKVIHYARERKAFGKSLSDMQVIRHKISEMATLLEVCIAFTEKSIHKLIDKSPDATKFISMSKAFTSEYCFKIINEGLQILGGNGFMEDYGLARALRDTRLWQIGAGTTEVMFEIVSKMVVDEKIYDHSFVPPRDASKG